MTTEEAIREALNAIYTPANGVTVPDEVIKYWADVIQKDGSIPAATLNTIIQNIGELLVKFNNGYFSFVKDYPSEKYDIQRDDLFNLYLHIATYCGGNESTQDSIKLIAELIALKDTLVEYDLYEHNTVPESELHFWTHMLNDEQRATLEPHMAKVEAKQ